MMKTGKKILKYKYYRRPSHKGRLIEFYSVFEELNDYSICKVKLHKINYTKDYILFRGVYAGKPIFPNKKRPELVFNLLKAGREIFFKQM